MARGGYLCGMYPPLLLGSQSPRRAQLLRDLGLRFRQKGAAIDERYPAHLQGAAIAEFLAQAKAQALQKHWREGEVLLCSDTVVWCEGQSLEKAADAEEAKAMLRQLSGKKHEVISALCLWSPEKELLHSDRCVVHFRTLSEAEIEHYVNQYQPFDKAGAYGIQEWIGMIGIPKIEGSYFTVMGLPTHLLIAALNDW